MHNVTALAPSMTVNNIELDLPDLSKEQKDELNELEQLAGISRQVDDTFDDPSIYGKTVAPT